MDHQHGHSPARAHVPAPAAQERDPVCGMHVDASHAAGGSAEHAGRTYHFCSPRCRARFVAEPARYVLPPAEPAAPVPVSAGAAEYTCPMHPQIVRFAPGSCPICGMALEPRTGAAAGEENAELRDMTRRFWASAGLAIPLLAIAMFEYALPLDRWLPGRSRVFLELLLASPICVWAAW